VVPEIFQKFNSALKLLFLPIKGIAKALQRKLDPKDKSYCFTYFLPTRLYKSGL
jgi:hypothetical protein